MPRTPKAVLLATLLAVTLTRCSGDPAAPDPEPQLFTITVTLAGDGTGTIASTPSGIACSADGTGCEAAFEEGTVVTLTATPAAGHAFAGWSGGCTGAVGCAVTVASATSVEAAFEDPATETEMVDGAGGEVASSDGMVTLSIPAGALSGAEAISITLLDPTDLDPAFEGAVPAGGAFTPYELGPDGLTFDVPITVRLETEHAATVSEDGLAVSVPLLTLLTTDGGEVVALGDVSTEIDEETGVITVTGTLSHFTPMVLWASGGLTRFEVEGVPTVMPVQGTFVASATLSTGTNPQVFPRYMDESIEPIERLFEPADWDLAVVMEDGNYRSEGEFLYTCLTEGVGTYAAVGVYDDLPLITERIPVSRVIRCLAPTEPEPLVDVDGALDGTPGAVTSEGEVAGRTAGRPAHWTDPGTPPAVLPGHPDNANGAGYAWAVSEDGSVLGGVVFDDVFALLPALWSNGVITLLPIGDGMMGGAVNGLTPDGSIAVGHASQGADAFPRAWRDGALLDLELPDGATLGSANGIEIGDLAVGYYELLDVRHPAAWDLAADGALVTLPAPPGTGDVELRGINDAGVMVGTRTDPTTGFMSGLVYDPASGWEEIGPGTSGLPSIDLVGISNNGVIACGLSDPANAVYRACVVAPGADPVFLDFFDGANTIPLRRGISRNGRFFIGGTDNGMGAYTEGWRLELTELNCPYCTPS